ncbi:LutC/YkgG family protein [Alicyclobacillus suci]|uniref:LutC/YkgG family protein n=1 Tax=Alicyclobacillus suci TaxID=2816080 RepID=UPI001A8F177A|nr:LUD domain-containing protein [Alicyclobacillus suci]
MNKTTFLTNIASRLGRTTTQSPNPRQIVGAPEFWIHRQKSEAERVALFREQFEALGGEFEQFSTESALSTRLAELLDDLAPQQIGAWGPHAAWPVNVEDVLTSYHALRWAPGMTPHAFANVQASVTGCAYAIADTGSIVMTSGPEQGRSVHIMPLIHIVLMRAHQIRLRLGEVFDEVKSGLRSSDGHHELPASVHFVSGPSRSSDIENDQSIGVHGPARVIVLLLE